MFILYLPKDRIAINNIFIKFEHGLSQIDMPWPGVQLKQPLKGANQINISKFDKRLPKNATDKV
jgi:hypothetical protein